MGKKKKEKKGRGAKKTAQKQEKNMEKKMKKMLQEQGEDEIEKIIAEIEEHDKERKAIIEEKCAPPSPRCNMTFTPHPNKDEIIMFGGEFFNGSKTFMYNDLLFYNVKTKDWTQVKAPNAPPPRCAHQAVALQQGGGQLWLFGGEFASPTQSQFYHYKELWVYHLGQKAWEKVQSPGGPSGRSGHRMAACKKLLLVVGGFHDNIRDYKYFNDVHAFNLETYTWMNLQITGTLPSPRSGFMLAVRQDLGHVVICGGYSKEKIKRDVDKGKTHTDMAILTIDSSCKQEATPAKWRWAAKKQSGTRPSVRCGCTMVNVAADRAVAFGGVYDEEEDEEEMTGVFFNDMYTLDLDSGKWHSVTVRGKSSGKERRKRRKCKAKNEDAMDEGDADGEEVSGDEEDPDDLPEDMETLAMDADDVNGAAGQSSGASREEDVFSVKIGPQSSATSGPSGNSGGATGNQAPEKVFVPCPRMNPALAMKSGVLYMYGGNFEVGDKQFTLSDFYSLDLHKLDQWETIIENNINDIAWEDSDTSGDENEEDEGDEEEEDEEEPAGAEGGLQQEMDTDSDTDNAADDAEAMEEETPAIKPGEPFEDYFSRCDAYWLRHAEVKAAAEGIKVTAKQVKKAAYRMAKEMYQEAGS